MRYDYRGAGGRYLDYVIGSDQLDEESRVAHRLLMMRHHDDLSEFYSKARVADVMRSSYTEDASKGFIRGDGYSSGHTMPGMLLSEV